MTRFLLATAAVLVGSFNPAHAQTSIFSQYNSQPQRPMSARQYCEMQGGSWSIYSQRCSQVSRSAARSRAFL